MFNYKKNKIYLAVLSISFGLGFTASALAEGSQISLAEAVKMTLELSPDRFSQQAEVAKAQGGREMAEGRFNVNTSAGISYGQTYDPFNHIAKSVLAGPRGTYGDSGIAPDYIYNGYQATNTAFLHAELYKIFETGISATVSLQDTQLHQMNLSSDSRPNANTTVVNLNLNIPLLKNGGTTSAAAYLNAARKGQEAAVSGYKFFLTDLVAKGVIKAYWDYRVALDNVNFRQMSKDRVERISAQVTTFTSDPKMKGKLENVIHMAEAAQVNRKRLLIEAQQAVEKARADFAYVLGIAPDQIATVPSPSDEIPTHIIPKEFDPQKYKTTWRKIAMENRLDLQAVKLGQEAANLIVAKAERDLYPQVDLNMNVGYRGLKEGSKIGNMFDALGYNVPGPTWSTGVEFSYPLGNQAAEGNLKKARAEAKQAELRVYQTTRGIDTDILAQLGYVDRYVRAIVPAEAAEIENRKALTAWKEAPLTDASSIIGMLQTEQQLTESNIAALQIRADYAKEVAYVRYMTGVLGKTGENYEDFSISVDDVTQLPQ